MEEEEEEEEVVKRESSAEDVSLTFLSLLLPLRSFPLSSALLLCLLFRFPSAISIASGIPSIGYLQPIRSQTFIYYLQFSLSFHSFYVFSLPLPALYLPTLSYTPFLYWPPIPISPPAFHSSQLHSRLPPIPNSFRFSPLSPFSLPHLHSLSTHFLPLQFPFQSG